MNSWLICVNQVKSLVMLLHYAKMWENMITYMTTFVIVTDIYDYHDYSAYGLVTKAISRIFGHSHKCHSHWS
jgi:hypothetical protein